MNLKLLNDWLMDAIWDLDDNAPGEEFAYDIARILSEYSSGHLPIPAMKSQIETVIQLPVSGNDEPNIERSTMSHVRSVLDVACLVSDSGLRVAS